MFVYYHGTKADFIKKGFDSTYEQSLVFIRGGSEGTGECIYTRGNYFANFSELIKTLNYVKGIGIKNSKGEYDLYNSAIGGGYVTFSSADPTQVTVSVDSSGIEISLTKEFLDKIDNIESDLKSVKDNYLTSDDRNELEKLIESEKTSILGNVSDDYNTLEKLEQKVKSIIDKVKGGIATDVVKNEDDSIQVNILVDETSIVITENKISVNTIDGGEY